MSEGQSLGHVREAQLLQADVQATIRTVDPLVSHQDVTTIMRLLGDIHRDVVRIRELLEEDDGEEEAPEDDA